MATTKQKLPSCFFNPKEFKKALLHIRRCYLKGLTDNEMVDQLLQFHHQCQDEDHKRILEKLMTSVYEFDCESIAIYYANHYGLFPEGKSHGQMSYSYHYLKELFLEQKGRFTWLDDYSQNLLLEPTIERSFDDPRYWMVVPPKEKENVITLCKDAELYCVVEENMTINLVVMVNQSGQYIIAEDLDVTHPCYLSYNFRQDHDKFLSPVYKLRSAKKILEYLLAKVGFPYVPIRMKVIFTSADLTLTNLEDYTPQVDEDPTRYSTENFSWYDMKVYPERWEVPEPNKSELWEGVDVIQVKDLDKNQGFLLCCPYKNLLLGAKDKYDREMIRMLYASLAATSIIYNGIYDEDGGNLNCTTLEDMAYWCDEFNLFISSNSKKSD